MEIREANQIDLPDLLALVEKYHQFEGIELDDAGRQAALTQLINSDWGKIWVAQVSGRLVAYLALCKGFSIESGGQDGFIDELYVEAQERGKGIGRRLLNLALSEAKAMGIRALYLIAEENNHKALSMYSRVGFRARSGYQLLDLNLSS